MEKLVTVLTAETQSLKIQYVDMVTVYTTNEHARLLQDAEMSYEEWVLAYNCNTANNPILSKVGYARRILASNVKYGRVTLEQMIEKAVKNAEEHYTNSILKLAARISAKGLSPDTLTVETSHIGVNIETRLTDGKKNVRAFTIIAGGPIQQPHYRYLIK